MNERDEKIKNLAEDILTTEYIEEIVDTNNRDQKSPEGSQR
jgi:hypothetical protein